MKDVVVIGAGIIGSAIALELRRRGLSVLLCDRTIPSREASWASGGMLAPQLEAENPDPRFELGLAGRTKYSEWISRLEADTGLDVGYRALGLVKAFATTEELESALTLRTWQKQRGLRIERIDRRQLAEFIPGAADGFAGGLYFPDEAQVDPRRLMRALFVALTRAGVEQRTGAEVRALRSERDRVTEVALVDEAIAARHVVLAAGAWSGMIAGHPLPDGAVRPARGQMIALDAGRDEAQPYFWVGHTYAVPRADGTTVVGSTIEHVGFDKTTTAGAISRMLGNAIAALPHLANARIVETWAGLRPWSADERPIIGTTRVDGLLVATGHYRAGVVQAPSTAELVADILMNETPALDPAPFSLERFSAGAISP